MPPAHAAPVPPQVPGYTLQELLGRGGSGEVWRAEPRGGGTAVAVKVLVAGDPERQAREAALLGELDHPHLVRLHEVVHQPTRGGAPRVALVLDLLAGGSLGALLGRRGRLRPGEVVTAIAPVAAALAHAHDRGVVHGDLSPGNIVFTADGRPVLTDLGVARVLGEAAENLVTPAYVDPTVARGGAQGPASDVFGIAAAAFHALTGVAPWNGARPVDALAVAVDGQLPDLAELAPEAPEELRAVIARGLAADPHLRGSAAAFALDLRHACRPEPVRLLGVAAEHGATPRTELTHQVPGRRPRPAPVIVATTGDGGPWRALRRIHRTTTGVGVRRRAGAAALVLAVGCGAVWLTAPWKAPGPTPGSAADETAESGVPAAEVRAADVSVAAGAAPTGTSTGPPVTPRSTAEWQQLLDDLYALRAEAFATGRTEPLAAVYAAGSPLARSDEQQVAALDSAGERLRGFRPRVVTVEDVAGTGDRRELRLVDRWAAYDVVPATDADGPALREAPARDETVVRMVLVRSDGGWRIEEAQRVG